MKNPIVSFLSRAGNGLAALTANRSFWLFAVAFCVIVCAPETFAAKVNVFGSSSANTAGLDQGASDFAIILYKIFKVVAVIVGALGVWRLIEGDYKWAVGCFACFVCLFFMPTIVETAEAMGRASFNATAG